MADRVERADGRLPHSGVAVAQSLEERLEGSPVTEARQRRHGDTQTSRSSSSPSSAMSAGVARASPIRPSATDGGSPRVGVASAELLDQQIRTRGPPKRTSASMTSWRTSALPSSVARAGGIDGIAHPAENDDERA